MVGPRRRPEEPRIGGVVGLEAGDEFRPDLVVRLANHRPERCDDAVAAGTAPFHGRDRRLEHPGRGAAPARMGGADHPGPPLPPPDRAAIRPGDPPPGPPRPGAHGPPPPPLP